MANIRVFRGDIGQVVTLTDKGDGTYAEQLDVASLPKIVPAAPTAVVNLTGSASEVAGGGAIAGPFAVPNDGRAYFIESLWAQVGPGAAVSDNVVWQKENTSAGALLAILLQAVRQSTTVYTTAALGCHIPILFGERLIARWSVGSGTVGVAAGAVIAGYA